MLGAGDSRALWQGLDADEYKTTLEVNHYVRGGRTWTCAPDVPLVAVLHEGLYVSHMVS